VDQLLHDAALQKLPVVLCLDRAGISGEDGATHHGVFDLPLTLPIPGVKIYAPLSGKELEEALRRAFAETECPSVIRYAKDGEDGELTEHFPLTEAVEWKDFGTDPHAAIVTFGRSTKSAVRVAEASQKEGISCRVIRFGMLKGFDPTLLAPAFSGIGKALLVEEGVLVGGFGSYLESLLEKQGLLQDLTVKKLGVGEAFVPHGNTSLLLSRLGLGEEEIKKEWLNFVTT
jgi:1-deoxy-D-xylulose-5-phosphate synthase